MSSELHRATLGGPSPLTGGDKFATTDEFKRDVGPTGLYARSKVGVTLFTKALVERHINRATAARRHTNDTRRILAFSTHPGAVATGQTGQYKPAWGDTIGGAFEAVIRPLFSRPDQGAISALWAGTSPALRDTSDTGTPVWTNGSYFTEAEEEGQESSEASDQEVKKRLREWVHDFSILRLTRWCLQMVDNFYTTSEKVIKEVVGEDGLGPWHAPAK